MSKRVCIIVDNPLRDLDGLTLLAWHLAEDGYDAFLVPMYEQGFDVPALKPDLVLVNYVRPNNLDLLCEYRRLGIKVGVLDTEGAPSKGGESLARQMLDIECEKYVDLYCLWGDEQFKAFRRLQVMPDASMVATGCPRYDFCAPPWRSLLENPCGLADYVLVNTNFPTVNPRFSSGSGDEIENMVAAGFEREFAKKFVADAGKAKRGIVNLLKNLLRNFPEQLFVLRPHPFESEEGYSELFHFDNFQIHQKGTSMQWVESAKALLHLNCSTAVEAIMLGKEPISPAWLDTSAIHAEGPASVSFLADTFPQLQKYLADIIQNKNGETLDQTVRSRSDIVRQSYGAMDGHCSERVVKAISECLKVRTVKISLKKPSVRGQVVVILRRILGYRTIGLLRRACGQTKRNRLKAKRFEVSEVRGRIEKINAASSQGAKISVGSSYSSGSLYRHLSGMTVRIFNKL